MSLTFDVIGEPKPQGSSRAFLNRKTGQVILANSSSRSLNDWRREIAKAAADEMERCEGERYPRPMTVRVNVRFFLQRPKTQTKAQRAIRWVATKPDIDKLLRAALDAMTVARVYDDDSQVASIAVEKVYADEHFVGAEIVVRPLHYEDDAP